MNNWISNAVNNFKKFNTQVNRVELNVLGESKNFMEVFERNLYLEKEIEDRTDELNQANKSILTLQHVWETVNSSQPLSNVLATISNQLCDEMEYLYSMIFQVQSEGENKVLRPRATSENQFNNKIQNIIKSNIESFSVDTNNSDNILVKAIKTNEILITKNLNDILISGKPEVSPEKIQQLSELITGRAIIVIPIPSQKEIFGCLVLISFRNEITFTEKNFLSLFARHTDLAVTIANLFEEIRRQAITDGLTGIFNRRHFDQCFISEADRANRLKQPFSLIMLDMDFLKKVNDTLGHSAGDLAITRIGDVLKQNARSIDIPARFGGEEFALLLPGVDIEGAEVAAERLRAAIANNPIEGIGQITASIGVATYLRHADNVDKILELADEAMYLSKKNGRNQVTIAKLAGTPD